MYKITIIIPHRNIPSLLQRCIDSIPHRDDIKIVIVDDNSDSNIVEFKNFPGKDQKNIFHVFLKKSLGGGGARNAGLNLAEGDWILFADSDDFFNTNLSDFIDEYINSDADLIVFDTNSVLSDTLKPVDNREDIVSMYKKDYDENILRYCHHSVWGKMFRLELIKNNNIRFQEVAASNDAFFAACAGDHAKKVLFCPKAVYCCTVRRGSICTRLTLENIKARIYVVETVNRFLRVNNVSTKYWMNRLGPLFNLRGLSQKEFIKAFVLYLWQTAPSRLYRDFKESGGRFLGRLKGRVNDKDIKKIQAKE